MSHSTARNGPFAAVIAVLLLAAVMLSLLALPMVGAEEDTVIAGYVTDSETGDPLPDVVIYAWGPEYGFGTTDEDGYYEILVDEGGDYELHFSHEDYRYHSHDGFTVMEGATNWYNATLTPIPPSDMVLKGYVTSHGSRDAMKADVMLWNILTGGASFNETDDTGYYEMEGWSGLNTLDCSADGHYTLNMFVTLPPGEHWYNLTLFPIPVNDGWVRGYVSDGSRGPVEGVEVFVVNAWTGMNVGGMEHNYVTETDEHGFFELNIPKGNWYLVADHWKDETTGTGMVTEIVVDGDEWKNLSLPEAPELPVIEAIFDGWDTILGVMRGPFVFDTNMYLVRLNLDMMLGNRDGAVSPDEAALFEFFVRAVLTAENGNGGMGMGLDETTEGHLHVDGVYYETDLQTLDPSFTGLVGSVTSQEPVNVRVEMTMNSHSSIPAADSHTITIRMNSEDEDDDEGGFQKIVMVLPAGFVLDSHTASANVHVDGVGTDTVTLEWVGTTRSDTSEMVNLTVTRSGDNIPPRANAGQDMEAKFGEPVTFTGTGTDTDGTIVLYEWDFNGDGTYDWSSSSSGTVTHTYPAPGIYTAVLRVTDNEGATHTDTVRVTVTLDLTPGANLTIHRVDLSHPKPKDGDSVTVNVTLMNIGEETARNATALVKVNGEVVVTYDLGNIPSGGTVSRDHTWTVKKGTHTIEVELTYDGGEDKRTETLKVDKKGGDSPGFEVAAVLGALGTALVLFGNKKHR